MYTRTHSHSSSALMYRLLICTSLRLRILGVDCFFPESLIYSCAAKESRHDELWHFLEYSSSYVPEAMFQHRVVCMASMPILSMALHRSVTVPLLCYYNNLCAVRLQNSRILGIHIIMYRRSTLSSSGYSGW